MSNMCINECYVNKYIRMCVKRRERKDLISMETHAHDIELMFNLLKSQAEIG